MLVGIPVYLQSVLNASARLSYYLKRSYHITEALVSLHWLRVPERIQYKVAVLTYKVLRDTLDQSVEWLINLVVGHYALPAPVAWWCLRPGLRSVVGPSVFLVRGYGMRCPKTLFLRSHYQHSKPSSSSNHTWI